MGDFGRGGGGEAGEEEGILVDEGLEVEDGQRGGL